MNAIISYSPPAASQAIIQCLLQDELAGKTILDVGAGEGFFLHALENSLAARGMENQDLQFYACDLNPHLFKYPRIECQPANLDHPLPYPDEAFDDVVSIEVIEHLENQFAFVRELVRITKPGGKIFVTTPNLLNINSRLRSFFSGFALLYGPLPIQNKNEVHTTGHIHPIGLYYLYYIFAQCGLGSITIYPDRLKKSSQALSCLFYPWIVARWFWYLKKLQRKNPVVYQENCPVLQEINSWKILCSRTLVISGTKLRS